MCHTCVLGVGDKWDHSPGKDCHRSQTWAQISLPQLGRVPMAADATSEQGRFSLTLGGRRVWYKSEELLLVRPVWFCQQLSV